MAPSTNHCPRLTGRNWISTNAQNYAPQVKIYVWPVDLTRQSISARLKVPMDTEGAPPVQAPLHHPPPPKV